MSDRVVREVLALISSGKKAPARKLGKLSVVTWNAFGPKQLIEKDYVYSPELIGRISVAHYYLPWDPVSHLGNTIGPVFRLPAVESRNPLYVHGRDALLKSISGGGVENAEPSLRLSLKPLQWVQNAVGRVADWKQG